MRFDPRGDYPSDWPDISRATRDEAGWRCVRCFHPFDSSKNSPRPCDQLCDHNRGRYPSHNRNNVAHQYWSPGFSYVVHHLDGDRSNQAWWNRLALCSACQQFVEARMRIERPWTLDESSWFVPYACGLSAHHFGGLEISRAQADAEPARWLALGHTDPAPIGEAVR